MTTLSRKALFWTPRALGTALAAFLSLFALDVFSEGYGFWGTAAALGIHLIPSAILVVILAFAWRREWIGTLLFAAAGVAYMVATPALRHPSWVLTISGPLFLIAALFLINWLKRAELHRNV